MRTKTGSLAGKRLIDMDTVRALAHNRFHVIKLYGQNVIAPVIRTERLDASRYCSSLFRKVRKLMTREDLVLDTHALDTIKEALSHSPTLTTVYQLKQQLIALWDNSKQHQSKRIERLQAWCQEAEQTGIESLQEFAQYLRGYTEVKYA